MNSLNSSDTKNCLLASFGIIQLTGQDSIKFLQGQISINAEHIEPGKLSLAALCNPQGRCIGLFFATKTADSIYLILKQETMPETIATLKKYAVFFKTEITDVSEQFQLHGLITSSGETITHNQPDSTFCSLNNELAMVITPISIATEETKSLNLPNENDWSYQLAKQKIPWLTQSTQNQFLPHELNLPELSAVDFKKGCFTGQEVIARMQYKGKLKSHMQLLITHSPIEVEPLQAIVSDEKKVGKVICSVTHHKENTLILAIMRDSCLNQTSFQLNDKKASILNLLVDPSD